MENQAFEIKKCQLSLGPLKTTGLHFIPKNEGGARPALAVFTHGYTTSKTDVLFWAQRLLRRHVESVIFDLPGHYLGTGEEVHHFSDFSQNAHKLFWEAFKLMAPTKDERLILGGHSLGGLLSLKALELEELKAFKKLTVAVGVGMTKEGELHPLEKEFFKETMNFRSRLVSPTLNPDNIFRWLEATKKNCGFSEERVTLITGEDDIIVPHEGTERIAEILKVHGNEVELKRPRRLPHHDPALASPHIEDVVAEFLKRDF